MFALKNLTNHGVHKQVKVVVAPILNTQLQHSAFTNGILNSGLPNVELPKTSLDTYVFEYIGKWENHTAVVSYNRYETMIHLDFYSNS